FIHRLDVLLKSLRRSCRAQLAVCINDNCIAHHGSPANTSDESGCMRRHRVTLKGRIAHCDYGSRLCAYTDRIRFRTDRNRPCVTDIDIVSAVVAQIPARKKAESGILSPWVWPKGFRSGAGVKFTVTPSSGPNVPGCVFVSLVVSLAGAV